MRSVVLLSGGLDSATTLAIAKHRDGEECHALSFDYGQRHHQELRAAANIAFHFDVLRHHIVDMTSLGSLQGSALTGVGVVPKGRSEEEMGSGIPSTYVPARNLNLLSFALGYAEVEDLDAIYIGVNAVDYSGYPDCRPEFIRSFQATADLATKRGVEGRGGVEIRTPLIDMSKAEIIRRGFNLGVLFSMTISCYDPNANGEACGDCDSCQIRRKGFEDASIEDSTRYQGVSA